MEMKMIAGDAVVQLLDIFKELELKLETTGLSLSHCSSLCVSGAVAERCPALQEDPDTKFFFIFSSRNNFESNDCDDKLPGSINTQEQFMAIFDG